MSQRPEPNPACESGPSNGRATAAPLVYVVDDREANAELVAACLEARGYRIRKFREAEAALLELSTSLTKPSLLISDFSMPKMDGLQLMRRSKQYLPGLKVILVTGSLDKHLLQEAGLGVDAVLDKPTSPSKLVGAVEGLIGRVPGT
ncbi:MAG: response regulator [Verrucomicrobia bacterium]|nr:response regulator [Verrucomicrobiota bacterium]